MRICAGSQRDRGGVVVAAAAGRGSVAGGIGACEDATVGFGDASGDGQAQPVAVRFAGIGGVQPGETLEDSFPVGLRDAAAAIGGQDLDLAGLVADTNGDVAVRGVPRAGS